MFVKDKILFALLTLLPLALSLPLGVSAEEKKRSVFPDSPQDNASEGMPVHTGKGNVTEAVDTLKGAVFDIGSGVTLTLPKGLPIGHSRLLTLKTTNDRPSPSQIHPRFQRVGPTLHFDGALNAARAPIVLTLTSKRTPEKSGYKLVLAIEEAGLCEGKNKGSKLGHGLCSTWRTVDASFDSEGGKITVKLTSTGGYRLQFGLIPES